MCSEERVKCDKVTVHLKGEKEPMVVERVCWLAKSIFPGSRESALQIIDVPTGTRGGGLFDVDLILVRPDEIGCLVLEDGEEKRTARLEDLFDEWDWRSS